MYYVAGFVYGHRRDDDEEKLYEKFIE